MKGFYVIITMRILIVSEKLHVALLGRVFANKDVNEMVKIFNELISNVLSNSS